MTFLRNTTLSLIASLACVMLIATPAIAQQKSKTKPGHAKVAATLPADVNIAKPDGWVVGKTPKGSVMMLRSAADESTQLEVRYTPNISEDKKEKHFSYFHTNLKQLGLSQRQTKQVTSDSKLFPTLTETEYALTSEGKRYILIVWHAHHKDGAWFFTAFMPEGGREVVYPQFSSFVGGVGNK